MSTPDDQRSVLYYDSIAAQYDAQMEAASGNRWVRDAFRELVIRTVPPPASILDFGCGTGIDTAWLAEQGYRVVAYDNSTGMMEELRSKCVEFIDRGQVITCAGSLSALILEIEDRPRLDAVVSNFAVFNLIQDLQSVFSALAPQVTPGGHMLLSLLNPAFWKDLAARELWAAWAHSLGRPAIHVAGRDTDLYRHWVRSVRRAARPHFALSGRASVGALIRRVRGSHSWGEPDTLAERIETRAWTTFPMTHLGQFFFLSLKRQG